MTRTFVIALVAVVGSSAFAAGDGPEEVIRALYRAHRPWEHKELNLGNRAVLSKYFSPELTKLFLKNAQLERDCPKGDLCGLDFDPILGAQDFDDHLILSFTSLRQRRRKLADSKHASNYLTKRNRSKSKYSFSNLFS
jgi:hypothetical protein